MTRESSAPSAFIDSLDHASAEDLDALAMHFATAFKAEEGRTNDVRTEIAEHARLAANITTPAARTETERFALKNILRKLLSPEKLQKMEQVDAVS